MACMRPHNLARFVNGTMTSNLLTTMNCGAWIMNGSMGYKLQINNSDLECPFYQLVDRSGVLHPEGSCSRTSSISLRCASTVNNIAFTRLRTVAQCMRSPLLHVPLNKCIDERFRWKFWKPPTLISFSLVLLYILEFWTASDISHKKLTKCQTTDSNSTAAANLNVLKTCPTWAHHPDRVP